MERAVALVDADVIELDDLPATVRGDYAAALGPSLRRNDTLRAWGQPLRAPDARSLPGQQARSLSRARHQLSHAAGVSALSVTGDRGARGGGGEGCGGHAAGARAGGRGSMDMWVCAGPVARRRAPAEVREEEAVKCGRRGRRLVAETRHGAAPAGVSGEHGRRERAAEGCEVAGSACAGSRGGDERRASSWWDIALGSAARAGRADARRPGSRAVTGAVNASPWFRMLDGGIQFSGTAPNLQFRKTSYKGRPLRFRNRVAERPGGGANERLRLANSHEAGRS